MRSSSLKNRTLKSSALAPPEVTSATALTPAAAASVDTVRVMPTSICTKRWAPPSSRRPLGECPPPRVVPMQLKRTSAPSNTEPSVIVSMSGTTTSVRPSTGTLLGCRTSAVTEPQASLASSWPTSRWPVAPVAPTTTALRLSGAPPPRGPRGCAVGSGADGSSTATPAATAATTPPRTSHLDICWAADARGWVGSLHDTTLYVPRVKTELPELPEQSLLRLY